MPLDRRQDWRDRTWEQDGVGKERVWENLRPRRWFFQSGEARKEQAREACALSLFQSPEKLYESA